MTSRKRNSPGIEINEIDRSQYNNRPDFSIVGTTTFVCGFADKGPNYTTEWINSTKTLKDLYGAPTNEPEKYFYNSAIEILGRGGIFLASKLPYDNLSKDKFAQVTYTVGSELISSNLSNDNFYLSNLNKIDTTLTSYIEITNNSNDTSLITLSTLDGYKTRDTVIPKNTFKIIDINRKQYDMINMLSSFSFNGGTSTTIQNNEYELLGIMPVIVSPINALYFQKLIEDDTKVQIDIENALSGEEYSAYISAFNPISDATNRANIKLTQLMQLNTYQTNFELLLSANSINDQSVSKIATSYFPNITYLTDNFINRQYLKQIGVVIFQLYKDSANNKKLNFSPVEAFIGSLDRNDKDEITNSSIYIDDIINTTSQYINFFSNIRITNDYKNASTILIKNQTASILGFLKSECVKNIDYVNSIIDPLTRIFDTNQDPNLVNIDIVCDAGVSNIAQYVKNFGSYAVGNQEEDKNNNTPLTKYNAEAYPEIWSADPDVIITQLWKLEDGTAGWKAVLKKYDSFCKDTRKDCIFLADAIRPFCLTGNEKIVRTTNLKNTIENSIVPNLKYITALNSSYSAGYCDWFYVKDYYTSDYFWLPPSIKAAGVCTYIDIYFHKWDAPAGISRASLNNVYDVAFSPRNDEAGKIYLQSWNYAVNYPIDGVVLEGQKTFQLQQTALDRINVRRLMIYLQKNVKTIARRFLYEGNTPYIRQRFVDTIRPIFEDAKNSYGIVDYAIRCDDTNNTTQTIENNELRCIIAVKPVKTTEWIICDFIVTNQSANVLEEVLKT